MTAIAKLFMHGRSQAVLLPNEFCFEGQEVRISKIGNKVILEPILKTPSILKRSGRELTRLADEITCRTAFPTIRRWNPIPVSFSTKGRLEKKRFSHKVLKRRLLHAPDSDLQKCQALKSKIFRWLFL